MGETALASFAAGLAQRIVDARPSGLELIAADPVFTPISSDDGQLDPTVAYGIALSTYAAELAAGAFEDAYATAQKMKDLFYEKSLVDWEMVRKVDILSDYARKRAAIPTSRISLVPDGCSPRDLVRLDIASDHAHAALRQESGRLFGTPDIKAGSSRMRSFMAFLADRKYGHAQSVADDCNFHPAFGEYLKKEMHRNYHPSG